MPSTKLAAGQQSREPGSMANMGRGGAERLTEQGWGGLQRECVEGMCVCGSGQGSCLIFSLLLAENAAASCSKGRESVTALAPLTQADEHFRGLSLFESSLTESSLSILQGVWLLFPHLASL